MNSEVKTFKCSVDEAAYPILFWRAKAECYSRSDAIAAYLAVDRTSASPHQLELLFRRPYGNIVCLARIGAKIIGDNDFEEKFVLESDGGKANDISNRP